MAGKDDAVGKTPKGRPDDAGRPLIHRVTRGCQPMRCASVLRSLRALSIALP